MHIASEEMKVKKLKRLEEGNEILPDDPEKFESFSINRKKKHKIKLWFGIVLKIPPYITDCELFTIMHIYENKT